MQHTKPTRACFKVRVSYCVLRRNSLRVCASTPKWSVPDTVYQH